jgi:predicted nuclease with TOPRIM domain
MEELKTKYPELDKLLAKVWGAGADALQELQEMKDLYQDLGNDDLDEAFQEIEETLDKVEELDTHRDKIREVLGMPPIGLGD